MNLSTLLIPQVSEEMINTYRDYYRIFYLEMVRMSNSNLNTYIKDFIELITALAKTGRKQDIVRSAIGVVALHDFGYDDFNQLSSIFNRLLPQNDLELVKFTSWCAGQLTHHPTIEKSRYASLLFHRLIEWTRSKGRRNRNLAAAHLLNSLSLQCGSVVIVFFPALQSFIWRLLSDKSMEVLNATADAVENFTFSVIRYTRSDLREYLQFFWELCQNLLISVGDSTSKYMALLLCKKLIMSAPDDFASNFMQIYSLIEGYTRDEPLFVQSIAYGIMASLAEVDPRQFIKNVSSNFFNRTSELLSAHPYQTVESLCLLIRSIPSFMKSQFELLKQFVVSIINSPNSAFLLLKTIYQAYGCDEFNLPDGIFMALLQAPVTEQYRDFIITYSNKCSENKNKIYLDSLIKELKSENPLLSIEIFAEIPRQYLTKHEEILDTLKSLKYVQNISIRKAIPKAMFNLARMCNNLPYKYIINEMFHFALYDHDIEVRSTALSVLIEHADEVLASPEFMKFFEVFVNDDATTVRRLSFNLLEKLVVYNPVMVTAITRNALLDSFFVMRNVPSIRQRSRTAKCLPDLIKASSRTIKIYSSGFMEIAISVFKKRERQNQKFRNFLEVHAYNRYFISLLSSVSLLAKMDPEQVAKHGNFLIMFLCNRLDNENDYNIILNILNLIYVLLSAPASCLIYRAHTPLILSSVTNLLAKTDSLNERFACLKIIGAVGVLEVHQKPTPVACVSPPHIDDSLARQFYHPSRDSETILDDANLLKESPIENYYKNFAANAVLEIFQDESLHEYYFESVQALANIFKKPTTKQYSSADAMLGYFDQFVNRLLDVLMESSDFDLKIYLPLFANLINNMSDDISPFVKKTLELINKRFNQELALEILQVILELLDALKDAFSPYASETICLLMGILDYSMTADYILSRYVLKSFSIIGIYASDLLYLIIPQICEAIECEQTIPKVRVYAFHALSILTKSVDLFSYLGPILRALELGLFHQDPQTSSSAFEFLYSLLQAEGPQFLKSMTPILQKIKNKNLETKELIKVIEHIETNKAKTFTPGPRNENDNRFHSQYTQQPHKIFSEDAITNKALTPLIGGEQRLEQWLRSFMLTVVSNSPSDEIRACTILAASYLPLSVKLFNVAFLSCWEQLSPVSQNQITESFRNLLSSNDTYDTVSHEIIKLLVFMDKIERPLMIPVDELIEASIRYGGAAFALLLTNRGLDKDPNDIKTIEKCIDLYAQLNSWPNAIGMWNKSKMKSSNLNKVDMLVKLKRWDQAKIIYQQHLERRKDIDSLVGLAKSLSALAMWEDIMCLYETFKKLSTPFKARVAPYLAQAAMRLGEFKILDDVLESAPETSLTCTFLSALNALHKKEYQNVEQFVAQGFTLIASSPIAFLADDQQLHHDIMVQCQELVEIKEMKDWVIGGFRKEIEEVWNERLKTAPRDFDMWFGIIANRASFIEINDNNIIKFFSMQSATLGTKLHTNAFESIFPSFDWETAPDLQKVCYVVAEWNTGKKKEALQKMSELTTTLKGNLLLSCQLIYSNWVLIVDQSLSGLKSAFNHLKSIIETGVSTSQPKHTTTRLRRATSESTNGLILPVQIFKELTSNTTSVDLLRKWRDVNLALFSRDKENSRLYIIHAIDALARCSQIQPTFPDTVLLMNLFFENAHIPEIFNSQAQKCIESLPPKLLIQASPQLLVQLSHQTEVVAKYVHDLVIKLLDVHYHELLFSVIVLTKSKDANRSRCAHVIFKEFQRTHPEVAEQVLLIRKCLLRASRTWPEMMSDYINNAVELLNPLQLPKLRKILDTVTEMGIKERAKCQMHVQFQKEYGKSIKELESILESLTDENDTEAIKKVNEWCHTIQTKLNEELKRITTIQMSSISPELCERTHFLLAVFGTYKPNRPIIPIQYFVGQFSVFMTKQQPKDVVVKGEDGNFYQYLLKGHEDLRLDERIMQFFRLINVLLMKKSSFNSNYIQTICVIPLSNANGLIQWVPGAETLRTIVENYRLLHEQDPMLEYTIASSLTDTNYDYLQPIQKMQIIDYIFDETPDTDLANYFWLKAPSAEMWMKRSNTFAISTAINSIVGYIIGLGDRHPSNLMIDRNTGKVIHIDFGDCFEKAMKRSYLPEVVPFRLTRMMVKAFGAPGVNGTFRSSFIDMSTVLRANSRILILVLAIFVHEPLVDPKELDPNEELMQCSSASGIFVDKMMISKEKPDTTSEIRIRVGEKLSGKEIKEGEELSVEEQASILIDMATDKYNLSQMYSGWCPFW